MKISELISVLQQTLSAGHDWEVAITVRDDTGGSGHAPVTTAALMSTKPYDPSDFTECYVFELMD